ncbi:uncharacterized protein LOC134251615 [Saccostrea cucullata]|uniref:uncharacterized protein LOC134251615 n=1 Tax=Saccostrea cuccullata TaxID=36930 RepID=UPI002ED1A8AC
MSLTKLAKLLLGLCCVFVLVFCKDGSPSPKKVEIYTIVPPPGDCEKKAKDGNLVQIHFKGTLENGTEFFNSYEREPISFAMGSGQIIKGIEQGVDGMCEGEKRRVTIPPALAYGSKGSGDVPGGATVILEIEVLTVKDQFDVIDQFHRMDVNKDGGLDFKEIEEVVSGEQFQKMMPVKMDDSMRLMMIQTLFTMSDKNRDGQLDPSEFTHMSKMGANAMKKKKNSDEL